MTLWGIILLWAAFGVLIWSGKHMSVHDIKDFHGAYIGESYLLASVMSRFLFGLVVVVMIFAVVHFLKKRKIVAQILAFLSGGGWIAFYMYICQKIPYFF
jgi:hypothetical protein